MQTQELIRDYGPVMADFFGVPCTPKFIEEFRRSPGFWKDEKFIPVAGMFGNRMYHRNHRWEEALREEGRAVALREGRDPVTDWEFKDNLVTNEGLADIIGTYFVSGTQITTWYTTLSSTNTSEAATMTAATPVFTEIDGTDVTETIRETWTGGSVTGTTTASVDNSGSVATYTCNTTGYTAYAAAQIGGGTSAFGNTAGVLYSYSLFASSKTMSSTDTIDVTYTFTGTSA